MLDNNTTLCALTVMEFDRESGRCGWSSVQSGPKRVTAEVLTLLTEDYVVCRGR